MSNEFKRPPLHSGDEQDVHSKKSRKILKCLQRAGVAAKTKRRTRRSERAQLKRDLEGRNYE